MTNRNFEPIMDAVKDHFFTSESLNRVAAFADAGVQREGWFNGELVYLLSKMKERDKTIKSAFEYHTGDGKKCDLWLELAAATAVIEIKAAALFWRGGTVGLGRWATDCAQEVQKFLTIPATSHYILLFAYRAPRETDWQTLAHETARLGASVTISRVDTSSPGRELAIGWLHASTQA